MKVQRSRHSLTLKINRGLPFSRNYGCTQHHQGRDHWFWLNAVMETLQRWNASALKASQDKVWIPYVCSFSAKKGYEMPKCIVKHNPNKLYVRQPDFRNTEDQPYPTSVADAGFCGGGGGARGLAPLSVHLCLRQGLKYLD